ncbi:MAG: chemotaxis protein CheW, partial [Marinilabiliaceae bacterium]
SRREMGLDGDYPDKVQMVIVHDSGQYLAIPVDRVIGNIQAVLKPLGSHFRNQSLVSAATIMGDGSIALVLDVQYFFARFK